MSKKTSDNIQNLREQVKNLNNQTKNLREDVKILKEHTLKNRILQLLEVKIPNTNVSALKPSRIASIVIDEGYTKLSPRTVSERVKTIAQENNYIFE